MSQVLPPNAVDWNNFFNLAAVIALVALAVVIAAMVLFTLRYRERKNQPLYVPPKRLKSRARDAMIFAIISIIILFVVTVVGDRLTPNARFAPTVEESYPINVVLFQWGFNFTYPNGQVSLLSLNVPANTTIMFNVTSRDVMHNFYLVQYKVSIDAVPGRHNVIWITTPQVEGNNTLNYEVICKELCGTGHASMRVPMTVMSQDNFNAWVTNQTRGGA